MNTAESTKTTSIFSANYQFQPWRVPSPWFVSPWFVQHARSLSLVFWDSVRKERKPSTRLMLKPVIALMQWTHVWSSERNLCLRFWEAFYWSYSILQGFWCDPASSIWNRQDSYLLLWCSTTTSLFSAKLMFWLPPGNSLSRLKRLWELLVTTLISKSTPMLVEQVCIRVNVSSSLVSMLLLVHLVVFWHVA